MILKICPYGGGRSIFVYDKVVNQGGWDFIEKSVGRPPIVYYDYRGEKIIIDNNVGSKDVYNCEGDTSSFDEALNIVLKFKNRYSGYGFEFKDIDSYKKVVDGHKYFSLLEMQPIDLVIGVGKKFVDCKGFSFVARYGIQLYVRDTHYFCNFFVAKYLLIFSTAVVLKPYYCFCNFKSLLEDIKGVLGG